MNELENLVPSIQYVVAKRCPPSWHLSETLLKFHNFMLILDGEMYISFDKGDNYHTVNKGYLIYSPKGMPREAFTNAKNPILCYAVNFQYALCIKDEKQWTIEENTPCLPIEKIIPIKNMGSYISLFKDLNREWQGKKKGYILNCRIILMEIIQIVLRENRYPEAEAGKYRKIEIVMNYISENHKNDISLKQMADIAGLSPVYFGNIFKKISGFTPKEYHNYIRICKAKDLLLSGGYTVGEAAESVGFNDIYYFSRTFKKITGQNPSEFK
ncbi:MAG: helix-turn-helix transcriptional regulator [Clostridiaceae bacterium]|nr:helix-turn-helix transcriptional regulator [Clostridiaceae bacterium]